jgi:DNA-binding NtrC family response regulator
VLDRAYKILLVEPDAEVLEILVASLARRFDAHLTCVADAESCLDKEMLDPHDLVIAELTLNDSTGLALTEKLAALGNKPVILLADEPTCDEAIEAMRLGVRDLFRKPFAVEQLLDAVEGELLRLDLRRRHAARYRRMRDLVRRMIRERRTLNRRMELICRDLVEAQRRLVHRVLALEDKGTQQAL